MTVPATEVPATGTPESTPDAGATPDDQQQQAPIPEDEVAKWKKLSRDNEKKAKENAAAASELAKIRESQKTDQQKVTDAAAQAERERDEARAETIRWKAAAANHVSEDNFDLLGTGTEDEITERAKRVGIMEAAVAELAQLKAGQTAAQAAANAPGPVSALTPGTPQIPDSSYPSQWFPQLNKTRHQETTT